MKKFFFSLITFFSFFCVQCGGQQSKGAPGESSDLRNAQRALIVARKDYAACIQSPGGDGFETLICSFAVSQAEQELSRQKEKNDLCRLSSKRSKEGSDDGEELFKL